MTDLKDKTIVSWGGYDYFKSNIENLGDIKIDYICAQAGPCMVSGYETIAKEEILKLENPFVIISLALESAVLSAAEWLRERQIPFTHLSFLLAPAKSYEGRYIRATGGSYTDANNNKIILSPLSKGNITINTAESTNAVVIIGSVKSVQNKLSITLFGDNAYLSIGNGLTVDEASIMINTDGRVEIGDDCMFSHSIGINESDQHMIFDAETHHRINYPKPVKIGNHVWIGRAVQILGGADIADNCVVGARAVTSGRFPPNTIIAGCPAKVIRKNILWARDSTRIRGINTIEECKDQAAFKYPGGKNINPRRSPDERMTARMDIINSAGRLVDLEWISISDPGAQLTKPAWFGKNGNGYVLQSDKGRLDFRILCKGSGQLEITLRGIFRKDESGKTIPFWIDYTSFAVNGKFLFNERKCAWHDKPHKFKIPVSDGDVIECTAVWEEHIN